MQEDLDRFRMDFVQEIVSIDEENGEYVARIMPDPHRYEWQDRDGERYLYDKFDDLYYPEQVVKDTIQQSIGKDIYFQPREIEDLNTYIDSRRQPFTNTLKGATTPPTFEDKSEAFLQGLEENRLGFAILSLDMVGSTKLATSTDAKTYASTIAAMLSELSEVVPLFHGHILKYTGDGFIAYFPEPSFITKNDLAIECALALRRIVYEVVNPVLQEHDMPTVDVRIGLDSGQAHVVVMGSAATKQHKDIIGAVVNLAAKIQSKAQPGGIYLGEIMERNIHTGWRQHCQVADVGEGWAYKKPDGDTYKVFHLGGKRAEVSSDE